MSLKQFDTPAVNTWCPGCGNFSILMTVKQALAELKLEREEVVAVTGIGCHGKITEYINVNGIHTIHGRVLPVATAIKESNDKLTVIGFAGDAGWLFGNLRDRDRGPGLPVEHLPGTHDHRVGELRRRRRDGAQLCAFGTRDTARAGRFRAGPAGHLCRGPDDAVPARLAGGRGDRSASREMITELRI